MKSLLPVIVPAATFAIIGLLAAFGIAVYAPTPSSQRPDFERSMFILLPLAGTAVGWFIGYLATPFADKANGRPTSDRPPSNQPHDPA